MVVEEEKLANIVYDTYLVIVNNGFNDINVHQYEANSAEQY